MRIYPPLFLQRIWVRHIAKDFKQVSVKINKSLLNINYNNSIFGGTLFAAADPFYPIMFHQVIRAMGYKVIVWSKSAHIQFLKPGNTDMFFDIRITDDDIARAERTITTEGKFMEIFNVNVCNKSGEVCVIVGIEVYIRNLNYSETTTA